MAKVKVHELVQQEIHLRQPEGGKVAFELVSDVVDNGAIAFGRQWWQQEEARADEDGGCFGKVHNGAGRVVGADVVDVDSSLRLLKDHCVGFQSADDLRRDFCRVFRRTEWGSDGDISQDVVDEGAV